MKLSNDTIFIKLFLTALSRVGGSGTMILSKWKILETDSYSFSLHGHLHQVIH